jgi:hypothetical protein
VKILNGPFVFSTFLVSFVIQMTILRSLLFLLSFAMLFISCGGSDASENAIARVNDRYLSKEDLARALPYGLSKKDSAAFADDYIDQWIRKNAVLQRAENNLTDNQKDVTQQLEDYRASLLIFAYERELIRQKLDTVVAAAEIEKYYQENAANFELRSNIIRLRYLKLPIKTPNADKARKWFLSTRPDEKDKLEQFAKMYAVNYLLDDANWLMLEDVIKEIPMGNYTIDDFNRNRRLLELDDKEYHYLVAITGFMVKDSNAPLSFERNNIRNIILNKRKIKLIEQMQLDAYNDAMNEKNIERLGKPE